MAAVSPPAEVPMVAPKTIMVVEDEELIRAALKTGLELRGYRVVAVANGVEALTELETQLPAVLLLDLILPRMDGVALAEELERRGLRPKIPIILHSSDSDARELAVRIGAESYLQKPLRFASLLDEVARLAGD